MLELERTRVKYYKYISSVFRSSFLILDLFDNCVKERLPHGLEITNVISERLMALKN